MAEPRTELDRVFDHDYDGIREYDNPMPLWWIVIFAVTVVFAFPYILHYHFGAGLSNEQLLEAEVGAYATQLVATYGDLEPDQPTLLRFMDDRVAMAGMKGLFRGRCAQCHQPDGSGNVGPNLTDDSWVHVKTITDIPAVVRAGVPVKGMPAWSASLTETQIVLLSAYVASLRRAPLDGKPPQGEIIPAWPAPGPGSS